MASAKTPSKNFTGICTTEIISFESGRDKMEIPFDFVKEVHFAEDLAGGIEGGAWIKCFDNSEFNVDGSSKWKNPREQTKIILTFITPVGKATINLLDSDSLILGATTEEKDRLISNMNSFLSRKLDDIVSVVGSKIFEKYFQPNK
jgi:hypothetical protein